MLSSLHFLAPLRSYLCGTTLCGTTINSDVNSSSRTIQSFYVGSLQIFCGAEVFRILERIPPGPCVG